MKKKGAIELYKALSQCKLTGMASSQKMVVLNNLRQLRPVSETYDADVREALEKIKPEGFDDIIKKVREHNDSINSGKGPTMPEDEANSAVETINAFNAEVNQFVEGLLNEESGVEIGKLDDANLEKLIDINDIPTDQLCVLYESLKE